MSRVLKSPFFAALLAALLTVSLVMVVQPAQGAGNNPWFTGCLVQGELVNVARGVHPRSPCDLPHQEVTWPSDANPGLSEGGGGDPNTVSRAAFESSSNVTDDNGPAVTATITAPRPGILVMGGSIEAFGNTYDSWGCRLKVDGVVVPGTGMFSSTNFEGGDHTRNYNEDCSVDGAQVVDTGVHTVDLDIYLRDSVGLFEAAVWVIWVPFDGAGQVPTAPVTVAPAAGFDAAERPDMVDQP